MSYDLMVFDPAVAPKHRADFLRWYEQQTQWSEGHTYNDPAVTSASLRAWFNDMRTHFPPMNGPFASDLDDPTVTDHCIGRHVIYSAFAWSVAKSAHKFQQQAAKLQFVGNAKLGRFLQQLNGIWPYISITTGKSSRQNSCNPDLC